MSVLPPYSTRTPSLLKSLLLSELEMGCSFIIASQCELEVDSYISSLSNSSEITLTSFFSQPDFAQGDRVGHWIRIRLEKKKFISASQQNTSFSIFPLVHNVDLHLLQRDREGRQHENTILLIYKPLLSMLMQDSPQETEMGTMKLEQCSLTKFDPAINGAKKF